MKLKLDGESGTPVYRQIVEGVRHQVAAGTLEPGERLPTVRGLATELGVDRNTALRAYRILERDGVISMQHGRGTFVRAGSKHAHLNKHRQVVLETAMNASIAHALSQGFAPQEIEAAFAKRLRYWRGTRRAARKD